MATTSFCVCSWGYVILVSKFVLLFVESGIVKSFGVLIPMMVQRLDSDYATVGLICSMPATLMYLCLPITTLVLQKVNGRFLAVSGGLLTGACILAFAFIENTAAAGICLALSGVGLSMSFMPIALAVNDFFKDQYILMSSITCYGYTFGSMLLPIVTERAIQAYGYSGAFVILGGISFNVVVCGATIRKSSSINTMHEGNEEQLCLIGGEASTRNTAMPYQEENGSNRIEQTCLIQNNNPHCDLQHEASPKTYSSRATSLLQSCRRSCGILNEPLYLFSIPIQFMIFYTMYAWMLFLVPHAEHLGIAPSRAIFLSTIGGIGGVIGRTLFIILVSKGTNALIVYIPIGVLCTASFLLDFTSSAYEVRAVLAFVQGFCLFIEDTIMITLCKKAVFDEENFDMATAVSGFIIGVGVTCAGFLTGYLFDVTQSFTKVFIIIGCIHGFSIGCLIILAILLHKRQ